MTFLASFEGTLSALHYLALLVELVLLPLSLAGLYAVISAAHTLKLLNIPASSPKNTPRKGWKWLRSPSGSMTMFADQVWKLRISSTVLESWRHKLGAISQRLTSRSGPADKGASRYWPIWFCLVAGLLVAYLTRLPKY